ncbi:MAG: ATP-binding protein [Clostridia bacterium]|nr:ATP-binding protein [Clostridia bacterium]
MDAKQIVKNEIAKLRSDAINKAQENKLKALSNSHFRSLDKEERLLVLKISKLIAEDKPCGAEQEELIKIQKAKQKELNNLGLTKEDLVPQFSCNACEDTGIINGKYCKCFNEKLQALISSTAEKQYTPLDKLNSVKNAKQAENIEKIKQILQNFVNNPKNYINILLCGKTGVGKTTLAEGLLGSAQKEGKLACELSSFKMNELFTKFHTTFTNEREDYLSPMLSCDYLLIDDLGTEPIKRNITLEYLYLLLSEREKYNKHTIITTNLNLDGILARYGERIFSRISSKKTTLKFYIDGDDLRLS